MYILSWDVHQPLKPGILRIIFASGKPVKLQEFLNASLSFFLKCPFSVFIVCHCTTGYITRRQTCVNINGCHNRLHKVPISH